jgi:streptomycin 6-kinase
MMRTMEIPTGLAWLRGRPDGRAWLDALPALVGACAASWELRLGEPFAGSYVSLVVPAVDATGTAAVLKVQFPDRESEQEAAALRRWDGAGAARLLAHDPARRALLIERCIPGTPLSMAGSIDPLDVLTGLLPRLWQPAGPPFRPLAVEAAWWASGLSARWEAAGRPFERRLVDASLEALGWLAGSQGEQVLLHQDLHPGNVLRAEREPWLLIDPKPLAGERELGVAPIVRSFELGPTREAVLGRLDRLTAELGLDRERARWWTIAQTVAWSCESDRRAEHVAAARWLLETAPR